MKKTQRLVTLTAGEWQSAQLVARLGFMVHGVYACRPNDLDKAIMLLAWDKMNAMRIENEKSP